MNVSPGGNERHTPTAANAGEHGDGSKGFRATAATTVRRWKVRRPVGYGVMIASKHKTLHHEITTDRDQAEALVEYLAAHPNHNEPVEFSVVAIYTEPTG